MEKGKWRRGNGEGETEKGKHIGAKTREGRWRWGGDGAGSSSAPWVTLQEQPRFKSNPVLGAAVRGARASLDSRPSSSGRSSSQHGTFTAPAAERRRAQEPARG